MYEVQAWGIWGFVEGLRPTMLNLTRDTDVWGLYLERLPIVFSIPYLSPGQIVNKVQGLRL